MQDLISIIVPVYNSEKYLGDCIDSILAQTYKNIELILIDDRSSDSSGQICDEYSKKDKRVKVIHHEKNSGQSAARNTGLSKASGDWIGFADCDDTLEPEMFEILLTNAKKYKVKLSGCAHKVITNDKTYIVGPERLNDGINHTDDFIIQALYKPGNAWIDIWTKLYHKSLLPDLKFPEGMQLEDYFVNFNILYKIKEICFTSRPLYNWMRRDISQGVEAFSKNMFSIYDASGLIVDNFKKLNAPNKFIDAAKVYEFCAKCDVLYKSALSGDPELQQMAKERLDEVKALKDGVKHNNNFKLKSYLHCLYKLKKV